MRMWNLDPGKLCRNHLLGEHKEMHMAIGCIKKKKSIKGYLEKRLLNPREIKKRHDELVVEFTKRGYNHKTPIDYDCSSLENVPIDIEFNLHDLTSRCALCKNNFKELSDEKN